MKLEAIIFDLDGTLIDSMGIWKQVDVDFLAKRNIEVPKDLFTDLETGNSLYEIAVYFKKKFNLTESIDEILQEWEEQVFEYYSKKIKLKPGVIKLLNTVKHLKLAVGTSNSKKLAKVVLKSNNIEAYFKKIIAGNQNLKGKPCPDIFLKAAEELSVKPENCLVIEDVLEGVQAAKAANMKVFAIFDEHAENKKLIKSQCNFYADSHAQIIEAIKKII